MTEYSVGDKVHCPNIDTKPCVGKVISVETHICNCEHCFQRGTHIAVKWESAGVSCSPGLVGDICDYNADSEGIVKV